MTNENEFINLGDFVLQKKLSEGTFGSVHIVVKNDNKDLKYAAKISKFSLSSEDESFKLEIKREVNLLAQLNHPYILKFIGYSPIDFYGEDYPVIITEFLPNGSLNEIIKYEREKRQVEGWTPTKKLINIFGIASIMSYLHKNKVIHRDLKPANVLENEYLFPKIADFGLSKINHDKSSITQESTKGIKGTIVYMAPEIITDCKYSEASDVYAYAFIVYEMVTLEQPFKNKLGVIQVMEAVKNGVRPDIKNTVPKCYHDLITKCWSQDPNQRPTFNEIVQILKTNDDFITDGVDKNEFNDYIRIVNAGSSPIDPSKRFKRITISDSIHINVPKSTSISKSNSTILNELKNHPEFNELNKDTKDMFEKAFRNQRYNNEVLKFTVEDIIKLFANESLDSPNFIQILNLFSTVIFELNSSNVIFKELFDKLSNMADSDAPLIKIHIFASNTSGLSNIIQNSNVPISITNADSMTMIEPKAYYGCSEIYQMIIPSSVIKIGEKSFSNCSSLVQITIPSSVKIIEEGAFHSCILLKKVEILSSLKEIKNFTFTNCESLTEINIPSSVEKIGSYAFAGCNSLEQVEIPKTVTIIGNCAFSGCKSLKKICIPPKITSIEGGVFYGCSSLKQIVIPASVISIEPDAFNSCESLVEVTFENPSKLNFLKLRAFHVCSSLEEIIIPHSVKCIDKFCFFGCIKLKRISIPSLNSFEENTFDGCLSLESFIIPYPASVIQKYAFNKCSGLKQVIIPNSVTSINYCAFNLCTSLIEIIIPNSVTVIESFAFNSCSSLEKLVVPSSVKEIGKFAFRECSKLNQLTFDASINKIEDGLFQDCLLLESIIIPQSVIEIGRCSFQGCTSLKTVELPINLTHIGDYAFSGCLPLKKLEIPRSVKYIGDNAFNRCSSLKKIRIPFRHFSRNSIGLDEKTKVKRF